ncbi:DUF2842 domain-containing protein [Blastomonas sp.]|uniref:DUF2842 domain-containing protein n=1 Tax=Blastomonas sp. TaxID=1909299 RepID=UPI003592FE4F
MKPTLRKPVGIFAILAIITLWAVLVASFSGVIGNWHIAAQTVVYGIAGIIWIAPMRPLMIWMETGNWRA